jgi:hypothetical protein
MIYPSNMKGIRWNKSGKRLYFADNPAVIIMPEIKNDRIYSGACNFRENLSSIIAFNQRI